MKTMFSRQFALTASLIILSVVLMGLAFRVFIGRYAADMAQKTLDHNADVISELAAAYDSTDALNASWDVRINLSFASTVADTNAVICDGSGTVIVCSCSTLSCEHLGKQLECFAAGFPDAAGTDTPLAIVQHRFQKADAARQ